jgi:hypothetical protein
MRLTPLYEQIRSQARRDAVLVDGLVGPIGERDGVDGLFSDKKGYCGQNVQVVATLSGRLADVEIRARARCTTVGRFASPASPSGGRTTTIRKDREWSETRGYQGTGIHTPYKKPPKGQLTDTRRACNITLDRLRAAVERAIAHLKCWKVLKTGFRRSLEEFPAMLRTAGSLPGVRTVLR